MMAEYRIIEWNADKGEGKVIGENAGTIILAAGSVWPNGARSYDLRGHRIEADPRFIKDGRINKARLLPLTSTCRRPNGVAVFWSWPHTTQYFRLVRRESDIPTTLSIDAKFEIKELLAKVQVEEEE